MTVVHPDPSGPYLGSSIQTPVVMNRLAEPAPFRNRTSSSGSLRVPSAGDDNTSGFYCVFRPDECCCPLLWARFEVFPAGGMGTCLV